MRIHTIKNTNAVEISIQETSPSSILSTVKEIGVGEVKLVLIPADLIVLVDCGDQEQGSSGE